jgi:hypothetical protein
MIAKKEKTMLRLLQYLFMAILLLVTSMHAEEKYKLGHGLQLGELPVYIGGYFSLEYEDVFHQDRSLKLDDVAVMVYGEYNNFSYMMELEANTVYSEVFGNEEAEESNKHFHIERLYADYAFNENYSLLVGKYNSPIGIWNRIPINVLRDTSSNPLISTKLFPQFTTGLDLKYSSNNSSDMTLNIMMQESEDLDHWVSSEVYNNFETNEHYAAGLSFVNSDVLYHLNAGYFQTVREKQYYYLEAAFEYHYDAFRFQAEVGSQFNENQTTIPYIGYIQGLYTLEEKHELIVRLETYSDKTTHIKDSFSVFGYTYRPLYPIAIKGEYQWHSLHEENRLIFSLSVLF